MTVMEFLDRLAETPRTWTVTSRGQIRCPVRRGGRLWRDAACPYTAICPKNTTETHPSWIGVWKAVAEEGFSWVEVWKAADNAPGHSKKIRRALLDACGL